jgi:hypothetical protein
MHEAALEPAFVNLFVVGSIYLRWKIVAINPDA